MDSSEGVTLLIALCISCLIVILGFKIIWRKGNLPPGPRPLPLLGNFLQLRKGDFVETLQKFSEQYGDLYTVYFGIHPVVVVTGYKRVKEILIDRGDDFLARGNMFTFDAYYKNHGIAFSSNMHRWRELRRFSLTALRDFGMGKRSTEERIMEEVMCLVAKLKRTKEAVLDPREYLSKAVCNVIFSLMFGNRQDYEDEELINVINLINKTFVTVSSPWGQLYDMFPEIMRFLPGRHQLIFKYLKELTKYIEKRVNMNQKTLDPDNPRDYIDAFLIKMEKEKMDPNTEFHLRNLITSTLQIFFAGVDTMSTTTTYSILILTKYPHILAKVHEEIDRVIGRNRCPKLQDRSQMPYTEAVIHEMMRFINLIPMGVPRKTTRDVELEGYRIPKDTNVFPMLGTVLKDPSCFSYPSEFNPQNFLDENGEFKQNPAFMPLSAGKRICLGEALVRMELFLFFVTILQNFTFKSLLPVEELDITPAVSGIGNFPKPYKVSFILR
ncbi:cytochrome P450 2G1 [Pelobates cultripes]|uniref:Cytochrome P450 2G1 n=1 Tax=Pelobates cultripes TaxID=61616 RepID=A0AAD1WMN6_PELCU|nr:cytochrome P450 2G1 [Pelobates cultripes]